MCDENKNIFEIDLKGFFDSVNLDYISARLASFKIPIDVVKLLYYINTCAIDVKPPYKLNEFEHMMKKLLHKDSSFEEIVHHNRPLSYMYRVRGVPQGAPTSPFLAILAMDGITERSGIKSVAYADDVVYFPERSDTPMLTPNSKIVSANVYFNMDKSGWVKKDGI
jgi:retron-type reverse transcriptase